MGSNIDANALYANSKNKHSHHISIEDLDLYSILQSPNNSNSEALRTVKEKLAKNKEELIFPSIQESNIMIKKKAKDSFLNVFPSRIEKLYSKRRDYSINEDPDYPIKYFHRKADPISYHRDAMIRASNLFKPFNR